MIHRRCRNRDLPTSLLVRNIHSDGKLEDRCGPLGHFGPLKDIYLPRDYHTGVEDANEMDAGVLKISVCLSTAAVGTCSNVKQLEVAGRRERQLRYM